MVISLSQDAGYLTPVERFADPKDTMDDITEELPRGDVIAARLTVPMCIEAVLWAHTADGAVPHLSSGCARWTGDEGSTIIIDAYANAISGWI